MRIIFLLTLFASMTSCGPTGQKPAVSASLIKVTDFRGKEIILDKPATRIVCLIESALSGLYMLHVENQVIGVSSGIYNENAFVQYALLDEHLKNKELPAPGNWDYVSIESLVELQPDLVIIWASQTESIRAIEQHGIPVYGVFLKSFADVYKEINDFGLVTGKSQRADSLVNYTRKEIDKLHSAIHISEQEKKNAYFIWAQGLLETAGTASTVNEMIELAGANNSCTIKQEHVVINKERLLDWNPDVIVMWYDPLKNPCDIEKLPELQSIEAIKNNQVYELPSPFLCDLWTLKFPYAVKMLAKWCYPSSFNNMNLDEEKQKMLVELYGQKGVKLIK